ncbi:MAG: ice-binding family protein [Candidatus Doudnabacteria bacterium]
MKKINILFTIILLAAVLMVGVTANAATSPGLGTANSFTVLSGSYTNTLVGTVINGDLGYTTGPAVAPTVTGVTHTADATYAQAGIDQGAALSALNSQPCTFTFAPGAIDLAADTTHGPVGVYTPGVYCVLGAADVGTGGITLNGAGVYIFRMTGALTTVANSVVTASNGATSCDVWWTPGAATTLGANSAFVGRDIDASGITLGNLATWTGRVLAFGGTVTTSLNTITTPVCASGLPATGSITVNKTAVGGNGTFNFNTTGAGFSSFSISTSAGTGSHTQSGLTPGVYSATEVVPSGWTQNSSTCGSITVVAGLTTGCTIVNTANVVTPVPVAVTPPPGLGLAATGFNPAQKATPWNVILPIGIVAVLFLLYIARRKKAL